MRRIPIRERSYWRESAEQSGFGFHTFDNLPYWDETAYYVFTLKQIEDDFEDPTEELHNLCIEFLNKAIRDEQVLRRLAILEFAWDLIKDSFLRGDRSLYGRFDFAYDGRSPAKLLEYNADTPTSLFEASIFQWSWMEDLIEKKKFRRETDQFNSIHDKLVEALAKIEPGKKLFGTSVGDNEEDYGTVAYILDCAVLAGREASYVPIEKIGLLRDGHFCDQQDEPIDLLFKLYPWEWMFMDSYGTELKNSKTLFIEPLWKSVLSNKGILPYLWEMEPNHPNLLPAYFEEDAQKFQLGNTFVKKPFFSREGSNVLIVKDGQVIHSETGCYGKEGYICQAYTTIPRFNGNYPVIGSWVINNQPAGIGIREDKSPITHNDSRFIPHIIID